METISFLLHYITPYVAVLVFFGGIIYQLYRWRALKPVPAHLSLFPRPESRLGRLGDTLVDMFTFKGLFRVNKPLWLGGFLMHVGLLLLFVGHVRVVTDYYFLWDLLRWGPEEQHHFSGVAGLSAGFLFMIPLLYLLIRRWSGPLKWLSVPEDYFILLLLIGIAVTGNNMRLAVDVDQLVGTLHKAWKRLKKSKKVVDTMLMAAAFAQAGATDIARDTMEELKEETDKD